MASRVTPQTRRNSFAAALLHLLAIVADGSLQRPPDALAIPAILPRFARPILRHELRHFSPALFDEHPALLGSRSAFPPRGTQWRNQHHRFQPPLAARQRPRVARPADRRSLVPRSRRKCQ